MNYIDCMSDVDLPSAWVDVFRNACKTPTSFNVILLNAASFLNYTAHLKPRYKFTCLHNSTYVSAVYLRPVGDEVLCCRQ